jgi:hypothetical protein
MGQKNIGVDIENYPEHSPIMNLANLAPAFTPETAREYQRRATESRNARIAAEKAEERQRDVEARAIALAMIPDAEDKRVNRTKKQIDRLLEDMEKERDSSERRKIASCISDLWKLVSPTAGVSHPGRSKRAEAPIAMPINTPTGSVSSQNNP